MDLEVRNACNGQDVARQVRETLVHLCRRLSTLPEFRLRNGVRARTGGYVSPQPDANGQLMSAFAVHLENGFEAGFVVICTGWARCERPGLDWTAKA